MMQQQRSEALRQTSMTLEVDVVAADILNREDLFTGTGINPGLVALWEGERRRRYERFCLYIHAKTLVITQFLRCLRRCIDQILVLHLIAIRY